MPKRPGTSLESTEIVYAQLATRVPRALHRRMRVHCVVSGATIQSFVESALEHKLEKAKRRRRVLG